MGPPRVCEAERVDATTRGAMAERRGFEPPSRFYPTNRLAGGCLQPLGHLSKTVLAEGVGFEPTELSLSGFQDRRLKPLGHPSTCFRDFNLGWIAVRLKGGWLPLVPSDQPRLDRSIRLRESVRPSIG
jgi:hypothetical protein